MTDQVSWAISIHTVTAFLYVGLGGRPFWNSAIIGPRFLASAFTAGPALISLALQIVRRVTAHTAEESSSASDTKGLTKRPATAADLDLLARFLPELNSASAEARQRVRARGSSRSPSDAHLPAPRHAG
jgi:Ni/Fe-hydrogenase subunit HybB-like protein